MKDTGEKPGVVDSMKPMDSINANNDDGGGNATTSRDKLKMEIADIIDKRSGVTDLEKEPAEVAVEETETQEETPVADVFTPDDALVERAVRAGLTLADAKGFTSSESAERILSAIEAKAAAASGDKGDGAEEPAEISLPEISDERLDELDPSIAEFIKGQSAALKAMVAEISQLKKAGKSAEARGFFETQYGALDESVRGHVDAVAKARLRQKFDMLEAGYKATGVKVGREEVFKEAVSLAISDAVSKANTEKKSAKIASRKGLVIAPPGGSSGKQASAVGGEYADIIAELKQKGFE